MMRQGLWDHSPCQLQLRQLRPFKLLLESALPTCTRCAAHKSTLTR